MCRVTETLELLPLVTLIDLSFLLPDEVFTDTLSPLMWPTQQSPALFFTARDRLSNSSGHNYRHCFASPVWRCSSSRGGWSIKFGELNKVIDEIY
ncbi:hypothetical protein E2C01_074929 [Portunus trituberculatus]|uniref:Uncharacterized protein n=1 Tax=Portunus trituberculatus TaxID=210409 RepID=A0A5B7I4R4_PORTR|nr:hypothetical protein [Portunus trituberculatus]